MACARGSLRFGLCKPGASRVAKCKQKLDDRSCRKILTEDRAGQYGVTMTTLYIDDRIAEALKAHARASGLSLEAYLEAIAQMPHAMVSTSAGDVREFDLALEELFAKDTHPLPAVSLPYSRREIYTDHD